MTPKAQEKKMYNLTWKLSVDLGFRYLIRLHFCELEYNITEAGQREFSVFINNKMAETSADVIKWSGGNGVAVYRDYMVTMVGDRLDGKRDIIITLKPKPNSNAGTKLSNPILNGLEIFKLSNPDNNLAGPNPMPLAHSLTSWTPNLIKFFLAFGIGNVLVILTLLNIIVYQLNRWGANSSENNTPSSDEEEFCRRFSFVEIQLATNNFDDAFVIGNGGFGKVYRGFIDRGAKTIAIKRLKLESKQGALEFQMEIEALSTFQHVHLVSLIGYCDEGREMILVYEYMDNGTLAGHLYKIHKKGNGASPLDWEQRLKICIGAARGLDYLHTSRGAQRGLIHRDVKSSNILLDENWVAKISDFGLSKMEAANLSCTHISTAVKGTFGYLDPEYFMTRRLTSKSDVYAFGVVLLEVLCGRPAVDTDLVEEQHSLVLWAQFCIKEGRLGQIVDTNVKDQISTHGLKRFAKLASRCVHKHPSERPTMAEVVAGLELTLEQPGRTYSDTEEDDINNERISNRLTGGENISKVDDNIVAGAAKGTELLRMKRFHLSNREPIWGWRWDSLWRRTRPSKVVIFLVPEVSWPRFSFSDILYATGSFNATNCIGSSGFGATYKAEISPGVLVAIKRLAIRRFQGLQQFDAEIKILGKLHHPNLVTLIAYHASETEMFLIYNYLPGGNLEKFIQGRSTRAVDWRVLHKIALDIARALAYLHDQCVPRVLHRDVKPSNILLDDDYNAYLSDFGLARLLGTSETHATTGVAGTFGYVAPEYAMTCRVSDKADVYSYGVVLLELISDKKALDPSFSPYGNGFNIVAWACMLLQQSRAQELFTAGLWDAGPHDDLVEVLHLAVKCTVDSLSTRPAMKKVVQRLKQLQPPSC